MIRVAFWFAVWLVVRAYAYTRPSVTIYLAGRPYLRRWFLTRAPELDASGTPGWYLHQWHAPDADRRLHNHPWYWATTRPLRGGYLEVRRHDPIMSDRGTVVYRRRVGDWTALFQGDAHRVASIDPNTWTLFHAGPKHGLGWGPKGEGAHLEWHESELGDVAVSVFEKIGRAVWP